MARRKTAVSTTEEPFFDCNRNVGIVASAADARCRALRLTDDRKCILGAINRPLYLAAA